VRRKKKALIHILQGVLNKIHKKKTKNSSFQEGGKGEHACFLILTKYLLYVSFSVELLKSYGKK